MYGQQGAWTAYFQSKSSTVPLLHSGGTHLEDFLGAQEAGHEPVEQAPQLADAVLDGRPAQHQPVRRRHRPAGLPPKADSGNVTTGRG